MLVSVLRWVVMLPLKLAAMRLQAASWCWTT